MLPESVQIGNVSYSVRRVDPSPGLSGETDWASGQIAVAPWLQGEFAVGVFIHEVTHALVYASGQHKDTLRGEEYVSTLGHVLHEIARSNPHLVAYLVDTRGTPMPSTLTLAPYTLDIVIVPEKDLPDDANTELVPEQMLIKVMAGLHPDMAAWEILEKALSFGVYRLRATETSDRYSDMVLPVAGLFHDFLMRNPAVTELLLAPIQRDPALQIVVNRDAQTLA